MKLNIGCGYDIKEGYINLDYHDRHGAVIHTLPNPLPYDDNSVDEIYCSHVLEDFSGDYVKIMADFHRVLKKGGLLHIKVPYGLCLNNPFHVRFFDRTSFIPFVIGQDNYSRIPLFSSIKQKINRKNKWLSSRGGIYAVTSKRKKWGLIGWIYRIIANLPINKYEIDVRLYK